MDRCNCSGSSKSPHVTEIYPNTIILILLLPWVVAKKSNMYPSQQSQSIVCASDQNWQHRNLSLALLAPKLLALGEQVHSLRVWVAQVKQLCEAERFIDEAFRDTVEQTHLHCSSSHAAEQDESLRDGVRQTGKEKLSLRWYPPYRRCYSICAPKILFQGREPHSIEGGK